MTDQGRVMFAVVSGAVIGGAIGYLYLTEAGRRVRNQIEPRLDDVMREIGRVRQTIGKAQLVAAEGWRSLNQIAAGEGHRDWGTPRQTSPF